MEQAPHILVVGRSPALLQLFMAKTTTDYGRKNMKLRRRGTDEGGKYPTLDTTIYPFISNPNNCRTKLLVYEKYREKNRIATL